MTAYPTFRLSSNRGSEKSYEGKASTLRQNIQMWQIWVGTLLRGMVTPFMCQMWCLGSSWARDDYVRLTKALGLPTTALKVPTTTRPPKAVCVSPWSLSHAHATNTRPNCSFIRMESRLLLPVYLVSAVSSGQVTFYSVLQEGPSLLLPSTSPSVVFLMKKQTDVPPLRLYRR